MDSRRLMIVVLVVLLASGLVLSLEVAWSSGDWRGFRLNLGTEFVGAVVIYLLFEVFIGQIAARETEKARLINEMGSQVHDVAVAAAEKLSQRGWLTDGSLQGARLLNAELQGAKLLGADLQDADLSGANLLEADLMGATLRGTKLHGAKLQKAELMFADLRVADLTLTNLRGVNLGGAVLTGATSRGADLQEARLGSDDRLESLLPYVYAEAIVLPDGTTGTHTNLSRFTDSNHPDFWRSDDPESPAYRGKE